MSFASLLTGAVVDLSAFNSSVFQGNDSEESAITTTPEEATRNGND